MLKNFISFGALAAISAVVACSANVGDNTSTTDEASKASLVACHVDSDCVAIPAGGCCPNGSDAAVNKHHVTAYENAHECTSPPCFCPLYVIHETRVAQCNTATNKCEMIQPEDIHCGGFTRNPHSCPTGYGCDFSGHVPDVPGVCKKTCAPNHVMCMTYQHWDGNACACVDNPHCGGIAGIHCAAEYSNCMDDPRDSCDPQHGGRDCGGICVP